MKYILERLFAQQSLSRQEAYDTMQGIGQGAYASEPIAAFLTVYRMRSITVEELEGFRAALLDLCVPIDLSAYAPIDLCGTGGDGKNTFNISTLAAFVAAGAGIKVAKHGNYGVSSACGSSNVMEHLGFRFSADAALLERQIAETNLCFLHAPLFHPAMRHVGPLRRSLGFRTFFNILGPMVNPARPKYQMVGVFSLQLARLYGYLYQQAEQQYSILHSLDGYDEVSLTGPYKRITREGERLLSPEQMGLPRYRPEDLHGGDSIEAAAAIFLRVLRGEGTAAQQDAVVANAATAIRTVHGSLPMADALAAARESLHSGSAYAAFQKLMALSAN